VSILRIFASVAIVAFVTPAAFAKCLLYEPAKVTVSGVITEREDFGPPGFGEDPKNDAKERHLYLTLDKSVCVTATPRGPDDANDQDEANVTVMQMVYFTHIPFRKIWLRRHVSVTGTLFHQVTGHHWTAVLIDPVETHLMRSERKQ
jgi:hypothetical protein